MPAPPNDLLTMIPGVNYLTFEQMNTIFTFQSLWIDYSFWMRSLVNSSVFGLPDFQLISNQLFTTLPENLFYSFRLFYGPEISQHFLNYFTHFTASYLQLINSYKNNETDAINASTAQWYQSSDQLSEFLSRINVYWDYNQWKNLFDQFIKLNIDQLVSIRSGNYEQAVNIFYNIQYLAQILGTYMARGIISSTLGVAAGPPRGSTRGSTPIPTPAPAPTPTPTPTPAPASSTRFRY